MSERKFELSVPKLNKNEIITICKNEQLIIIGSNGVGKSRLGFILEENNNIVGKDTRRISAQRSLSISQEIYADTQSHEGFKEKTPELIKRQKKFKDFLDFEQDIMFDFDELLSFLFSKHIVALHQNRKSRNISDEEETLLEQVIGIWNQIIKNKIMDYKLTSLTVSFNGIEHNASFLSDGERVVFYLIGQVLASPKSSILIIDEPELHIHKSLHKQLWDILEKYRSDCLFVYITHDLDFAASRYLSKKIWVKDYNGENYWDWEIFEPIDEIPDNLQLEILGSRKEILFVEGTFNSYDYLLYNLIFLDFLVIPVGSCHNVIHYTEAFNFQKNLHNSKVRGIVDRDRRVQEQIDNLKQKNINVLPVAEVENIFLLPKILDIVSEHLGLSKDTTQNVKKLIIKRFTEQKNEQVSLHVMAEIKYRFGKLTDVASGVEGISKYVSDIFAAVNVKSLYDERDNAFQNAIDEKDYDFILAIFNSKKLPKQIDGLFNLKGDNKQSEFINLLLRLLENNPIISNKIQVEIRKKIGIDNV